MSGEFDDDPLSHLEEEGSGHAPIADQLAECDVRFSHLASLVVDAIRPMTAAVLGADSHEAERLITADKQVDVLGTSLEEHCFVLIARQSPVAGDLRRLMALLRSINDIVRSGDLLRHVGESLRWIHPPAMPERMRDTIHQLGETSHDLLARGITAWDQQDALAAIELEKDDDQVDLLQKVLLSDLYTGSQSVEEAVSLALIARYYERIADHGVEIARHVAYAVTGDRLVPPTEM